MKILCMYVLCVFFLNLVVSEVMKIAVSGTYSYFPNWIRPWLPGSRYPASKITGSLWPLAGSSRIRERELALTRNGKEVAHAPNGERMQ